MTRSTVMGMEPRKVNGSNHQHLNIASPSHPHFYPQPPLHLHQQQQQRIQQQQPSQQQQHIQQFTQFRTRTSSISSMNSDNSGYSSLGSSSLGSPSCGSGSSASSVISGGSIPSSPVQDYRKLDRSISEPVSDTSGHRTLAQKDSAKQDGKSNQNVNSSRYKTELCRPFEEHGYCKYGDKCQFAHGSHELRSLNRHPKYKTELCRTYHTIGFCPYGPRCHFIHNDEERRLGLQQQQQQQQQQQPAAAAAVATIQGLKQLQGSSVVQVPAHNPIPPASLPSQLGPVTAPTQYPHSAQAVRLPPQALTQPPPQPPQLQPPPVQHLRPKSLNFNNLVPIQRDLLGSTADSPRSSDTDSPPTLSPTFFG